MRQVRTTLQPRVRRTTNWYAPGVGLVKLAYGDSAIVLKSFAPGKE